MPKVIYYTACTLDGFIADEHNSLDWLFEVPHGDDETAWDSLMAQTGAMVMGATTYAWVLDQEPGLLTDPAQWKEWYGERPAWVFTHRTDLPRVPGVELRFVQGDVRAVYDEVGATIEGGIWLVGGGDLVGQFDDAGLLDEIVLGMCPVTLGAGAPLLPRRITSKRLHVTDVAQSGQQVRITLAVDRRT
ncbi:dihydrofolate reductase family protein [Nocardioides sp. KR10-350]|uniref:dihydrofolate reductase family protein n=1 Tax=Nocardioides cheoyonin TaxID=3156615 RepID=UPI0032B44D8A